MCTVREGGQVFRLQQKRLGRNPNFALWDRFCRTVLPNEKFGTRYPDGVEPSHTVVCYHKILFNAEYLGEGDAQP